MLRLRQIVALLLLLIWTPAISHCLLEAALSSGDTGCCDSRDGSAPDHSGCGSCFSVEKEQVKSDPALLPSPRQLVLHHEDGFSQIPTLVDTVRMPGVLHHPDDTPPVPPADLILQATIAQPVRGPSSILA